MDSIKKSILADRLKLKHFTKLAGRDPGKVLIMRIDKRNGIARYFIRGKNDKKAKYVRKSEGHKVLAIQKYQFGRKMCQILKRNIEVKERALAKLLDDDVLKVIAGLPEKYRMPLGMYSDRIVPPSENPYRREEMTVETSFGLMVRTRGEAIIAEYLYALGIEFYYERALVVDSIVHGDLWTYYPDFTIVLADGSLLFWEHEGMLEKDEYLKRLMRKLKDYTHNNIYQSHNLMVSANGPNNAIDIKGIKGLIEDWLLPRVWNDKLLVEV